jgi:hypothetical protein
VNKMKFKKIITSLAVAGISVMFLGACTDNVESADAVTQRESQSVTNQYSEKARKAVPYPVAEMNTFLELEQQREKLLRFNNPAKIGYVYVFVVGSNEPFGYVTVRGKISSTNSQMTTGDQVYWTCKANHGCQPVTVESPSDDGSYGPNENGNFLFTTEDVYMFIPEGMIPLYFDAPVPLFNVPKLNSPDMKPTSVGETIEVRERNRVEGEARAKSAGETATPR